MKRRSWLLILTCLIAGLGITLYLLSPKPLVLLENVIKDTMFVIRGDIKADDRVAIIDIDEKSLKHLGQWPWSRNILAKVLENLTNAKVAAIGMDVLFAEEDISSPNKVLEKLDLNISSNVPDFDQIFADSIKNSPTVTGFIFSMKNDGVKPEKDPRTQAVIVEKNRPKESFLPIAYRPILNTDKIEKSSYSSGFLNNVPGFDGVVRSVPSVINYDGVLYPSLSIELLRLVLGIKKIIVQYQSSGVESIILGKVKIPTDIYGHIRVNFTGHSPSYPYISAVDIYNNTFKKEQLEGKIVLLGTSSAGLYDLRSSPFDVIIPGVEVHAHLIDNIINNNFVSQPQWSLTIDYIAIILIATIAFLSLLVHRVFVSIASAFTLLLLVLGLHYFFMFYWGIIFNSIMLVLEIVFIYFLGIVINYIFEYKQKELIKTKFANKVSKEVMEDIVNSVDNLTLKGDMKEISIFFSDIRGFTTISESMESPRKLIEFLNSYMTPMTDIIIKNKGTVDKFIGDAIMAYWNAPRKLENHADFALKSAIEQIDALKTLNLALKEQNYPLIDIGIGLNTGDCVVGEMGSVGRSDYTCIGDSVNLASRLEGLNKKYKTNIILSEFFLNHLLDSSIYKIEELGSEKVKGKNKSVKIYACYGYI